MAASSSQGGAPPADASANGGTGRDASIGTGGSGGFSTTTGGSANGTGGSANETGGSANVTGDSGTGGRPANADCPWAHLDTDPMNCGRCNEICIQVFKPGDFPGKISKVSRDGGNATTLALVQSGGSRAIAASDTTVYWGENGLGVRAVSTNGGNVQVLDGTTPYRITLDDTTLYWSTLQGDLVALPLAGGSHTVLRAARLDYPPSAAGPIALDSTNLYFQTSDNTVQKMPLGGGPATTLVTIDSTPPFPNALQIGNLITDIATDGVNVYYAVHDDPTDQVVGRIAKVPVGGGAPTTLMGGPPPVTADSGFTVAPTVVALAVQGGYLYYASEGAPGVLGKIPTAGGPVTTVAQGFAAPTAMVLDDANAYFTSDEGSAVLKVSLDTGSVTKLATAPHPSAIAVRNGFVYFTTDNGGATTPSDALSGGVCNGGVCAPCPSDTAPCFGGCARTSEDIANCGACGTVCAPGKTCEAGVCR